MSERDHFLLSRNFSNSRQSPGDPVAIMVVIMVFDFYDIHTWAWKEPVDINSLQTFELTLTVICSHSRSLTNALWQQRNTLRQLLAYSHPPTPTHTYTAQVGVGRGRAGLPRGTAVSVWLEEKVGRGEWGQTLTPVKVFMLCSAFWASRAAFLV